MKSLIFTLTLAFAFAFAFAFASNSLSAQTLTFADALAAKLVSTAGISGTINTGSSYKFRDNSSQLIFASAASADTTWLYCRNVSFGDVAEPILSSVATQHTIYYADWYPFVGDTISFINSELVKSGNTYIGNSDAMCDSIRFSSASIVPVVPDTIFIAFADQFGSVIAYWDSATYPDGWAVRFHRTDEEWSVSLRSRIANIFRSDDITDDGILTFTNAIELNDDFDYTTYIVSVTAFKLDADNNRLLSPYTSTTFQLREPSPVAPNAPTSLNLQPTITAKVGDIIIVK